jgi:hypothetical protein
LLQTLEVSHCDTVTDEFVKHITIEKLPNIKTLHVAHNRVISDDVINDLKRRMPSDIKVASRVYFSGDDENGF